MPRETSLVWQTVFRELWRSKLPKEAIARELFLPPEELEGVVFGLASPAFDPRSSLQHGDQAWPKLSLVSERDS